MLNISWHHSCVMYIYIPSVNKASHHKTQCVWVLYILLCQPVQYLQKLAQFTFFKKHDDKMVQLHMWTTIHASSINK